MDWYTLTIISMFAFGVQNFLFKVSAEKKCNTAWTSFYFMLTVSVISTIFYFFAGEQIANMKYLLIVSFINAITFFATTVTRVEALKYLPTSVAFPIIRMSTGLVVLFSVFYFKDNISVFQILGIILATLVIFLLAKENGKGKSVGNNLKIGLILVSVSLFFSAATTIASKFAAMYANKFAFISLSYICNTVFSFGLRKKLQGKNENSNQTNAVIIGVMIGLSNFFAFYMILKAMEIGPLSIISVLNSFYFIITIILSVIIYKEKITRIRALAISLSLIVVILMRM